MIHLRETEVNSSTLYLNFRVATEIQMISRRESRTVSKRSKARGRSCSECQLAWVLLSTVIIFSVLHIPRSVSVSHPQVSVSHTSPGQCQSHIPRSKLNIGGELLASERPTVIWLTLLSGGRSNFGNSVIVVCFMTT